MGEFDGNGHSHSSVTSLQYVGIKGWQTELSIYPPLGAYNNMTSLRWLSTREYIMWMIQASEVIL